MAKEYKNYKNNTTFLSMFNHLKPKASLKKKRDTKSDTKEKEKEEGNS